MRRPRPIRIVRLTGLLLTAFIAPTASAQQPAAPAQAAPVRRPPVFFRADWKLPPGSDPRRILSQEWINNQNLELKQYGAGTKGHGVENQDVERMKAFAGSLIVNARVAPDPSPWTFIWTGFAEGNWAFTFREKNNFVNLSGALTKIRWKSWQEGFQLLRPVIKTADGKYYVGDVADGPSPDWHENEIVLAEVRWLELNSETAAETGGFAWQNPDLSRVDEIGVTTLSRGWVRGPSARIAWIEVHGVPVPRTGKSN